MPPKNPFSSFRISPPVQSQESVVQTQAVEVEHRDPGAETQKPAIQRRQVPQFLSRPRTTGDDVAAEERRRRDKRGW